MSFTSSTAAETGRLIASEEGFFKEAVVTNVAAGARFLQVHDVAAVPADTAVPKLVVTIAANSSGFIAPSEPIKLENGCYVCLSSTAATKTIVLANEGFFGVEFDEAR